MKDSEWSAIKGEVEKWAKGKNMDVSELLKIQSRKQESAQHKEEAKEHTKEQEEDMKKRVAALSPEKAEERYAYLSSKPLSELTDLEYMERIALAAKPSVKNKPQKG